MPLLGLGVYLSTPEQTTQAVASAIADGYRLIDTAAAYGNERQVGEGIARSGIARSDVFVTTKLWISDFGYDSALRAFAASRRRLGLEYVDLYLLHWPVPSSFDATVASYRALEKLLAGGDVRAIGVSNFNPDHLDDLIARSEIVPAVNQVELNPYFTQRAVREANARRGVITQSWSPIGGVNVRHAKDAESAKSPLRDPVIVALAEKHGKTPAQVVLRWHLQHGLSAIPKSVRPERIAENFAIFDFELTADDVAAIDALDTGERVGADPDVVDTNVFTLRIEN